MFFCQIFLNISKSTYKPTRIRAFHMDSIIDSDSSSNIEFFYNSKLEYFVPYHNSFTVLPEFNMIIGVNYTDSKYLQGEISKNGQVYEKMIALSNSLPTIVDFNSRKNVIIVADFFGKVTTYWHMKKSTFWKKFDHGTQTGMFQNNKILDSGNGQVFASCHFGSLVALAGNGCVVIDLATDKCVENSSVQLAVKQVSSAQFCVVSDKILLALSGHNSEYSAGKTDLLDVTQLVQETNPGYLAALEVRSCD